MMNLLVTDEIELMLLGHMIRELADELRFIMTNRGDVFDETKTESIAYLRELEALITSENSDSRIYWEKFSENEARVRNHLMSRIESSIYTTQSDFAREYCIKLLDIFYSQKNNIIHSENPMMTMIGLELSRNFNERGGKEALVVYLVIKAFQDYYRYYVIGRKNFRKRNALKPSEDKLGKYIENIYKLKSSLSNTNELYEKSNKIIQALGRDAKISYVSSQLPSEPIAEHELGLPEEAKQRIGETILKSLQDRRRGEDSRLKRS